MEKWFGKILLFGEYTVIDGGQALAIPNPDFFGLWEKNRNDVYHESLVDFLAYLKVLSQTKAWIPEESISRFSSDLNDHLSFQSNIPIGYGLGSSGALVAGWYARYIGDTDMKIEDLQRRLSLLETHFHGASSGFDPLVTLLNEMILIKENSSEVIPSKNNRMMDNIKLIDTGISRSTAPLVQIYKSKKSDQSFLLNVIPNLKELNRLAIEAYLLSDKINLQNIVYQISELQWNSFQEMIPESMHTRWKSGLKDGNKVLKLCGAGGGGMLLQFEA